VAARVIWFTGLPCSGKSTLADALAGELRSRGFPVERLDGDQVRSVFPAVGFGRDERNAHVRAMGFTASRLQSHGIWVVASFVSPYRESRDFARRLCPGFVEVHVATPAEECERRDTKGMYARARRGELPGFTGVDDPYEAPEHPELRVDTREAPPSETVARLLRILAL
jgi:adenylylsulfate kinase